MSLPNIKLRFQSATKIGRHQSPKHATACNSVGWHMMMENGAGGEEKPYPSTNNQPNPNVTLGTVHVTVNRHICFTVCFSPEPAHRHALYDSRIVTDGR